MTKNEILEQILEAMNPPELIKPKLIIHCKNQSKDYLERRLKELQHV